MVLVAGDELDGERAAEGLAVDDGGGRGEEGVRFDVVEGGLGVD